MRIFRNFIENRFIKPGHDMRASQFAELIPAPGGVAFLGDSITAGGLWHEWFPTLQVVNRGIDGDTTAGLLARIDVAVAGPLAKVFLLIGTNDYGLKDSAEEIADRTAEIVDRIQTVAPDTVIHLQSVMPRKAKYQNRIGEINGCYRRLAQERGLVYVDLWPALADREGALRPEFTLDQLHLTGAGYRAWVGALSEYL